MTDTHRVTIRIDDARGGDGAVRFADFVRTLAATRAALFHTDAVVSKGSPNLDWRLVELRYSSPAEVTIEPFQKETAREDLRGEVVERFFDYADQLTREHTAPPEMDRQTLESFRKLATPVSKGFINITLTNERRSLDVPPELEPTIKAVLAPKTTGYGTVEGRLEFYNIHGSTNIFRIYPVVGPSHIECRFRKALMETAKQAIGFRVRVHGRLHYKEREDFPYRVDVKEIEQLLPDDELPSLLDIKGMAPDATGDLSSEEFVRRLRAAQES